MLKNLGHDDTKPPIGLKWRSNTFFIVCVVGLGTFTDMFLYGLIVPVLPFMLRDRVQVPEAELQTTLSSLLAIYAAASMLASPIAGVLADRLSSSRQLPFLLGLVLLLLSTILLALGRTVPVLALARFLQGASGGTVWTIGLALLIETVGQENLGKTIGSIFSFISVAGLFSPVIGGVLYAKTGYAGVFGLGVAFVVIDFVGRLLMIEKKVAANYLNSEQNTPTLTPEPDSTNTANESTSLLSQPLLSSSNYRLPEPKWRLTRLLPILLVMKDPGMLTALFIGLIQACLLGAFDATVPLVASSRYGFDSLKAGLLFLPLGGADFFFGPIFGWCVDRWGTKPISVLGFAYLVPALALLRVPVEKNLVGDPELGHQIALYACFLGLNGIGLAIINSASIVECGVVLEKYWKANPALFEGQAPYAQLYGINSMVWSLGLTVGPLVGGALRGSIGYGNMNAVLAGICGITTVFAVLFIGRKGYDEPEAEEGG
ncbi:major facilitator superfamily domain-containing protein [Clohesyomyces aquaticus]|uniref:Major facilitator superfamily domain-containing protein n=1 Tax=Clohesyomyces aquaticus TaxID=1231657 RepID=A0A1Y2A352_9PLEO|nr:major facilitator superfamily domain-containing protein [Clohesyomyces aquaticus]